MPLTASSPNGAHAAIDAAIDAVIQARRAAWNASDTTRYGSLLTEDCDIVSATGRASTGRAAVLALYQQQRNLPVYGDAVVTTSAVQSVRLLGDDVALADVFYEVTHVRWGEAQVPSKLAGNMLFVMQRDGDWKIASMRAQPPVVTPMD